MINLESLEAVTHTHNTFYENTKVSNTSNCEAILRYFQKLNKYKIEIEML